MGSGEHQNKLETLQILQAIIEAIDRRDEIFQAVEAAESEAEAQEAIGKVLGVGSVRSHFVLNMQARQWTRSGRARIAEDIEQLTRELDSP